MAETRDGIRTVEEDNIQAPPHYQEGAAPQIVTADTARQGPAGGRVLMVLVLSMVAIGVAWLVILAVGGHGL